MATRATSIQKPATAKAARPRPSAAVATGKLDARVDQKIADASPTLQPVLNHIRGAVHDTVPGVTETIKWGMSFFELDGVILAHMGIFKNHCSFGFWSKSMTAYLIDNGIPTEEGAGSYGRLKSMSYLPPYKDLVKHIRHAAAQITEGTWESPIAARTTPKPEPPVPQDFAAALSASSGAKDHFAAFPAGCRREYLEWITSAKKPETRAKRIAEAVSTIAQGKPRNWQYVR